MPAIAKAKALVPALVIRLQPNQALAIRFEQIHYPAAATPDVEALAVVYLGGLRRDQRQACLLMRAGIVAESALEVFVEPFIEAIVGGVVDIRRGVAPARRNAAHASRPWPTRWTIEIAHLFQQPA